MTDQGPKPNGFVANSLLEPPQQQTPIEQVSIDQLLTLEPHGVDTFLGITPDYRMSRIFGGQVVAQGLRAAQQTIEPEFSVHSLHAYFIRAGTSSEPIRYEVERIRNGRSFGTRRVVARQSGGAIFNLSASFQKFEEAPDMQPLSPPLEIDPPERGQETGWGDGLVSRKLVLEEPSRIVSWLKLGGSSAGDSAFDQCALSFLTDAMPTGSVRLTHPARLSLVEARRALSNASLDHVIYFHRPADPFGWLVADARCHSLVGGRGLAVVDVYTEAGTHALTVVQEILVRERARKPQ